MATETGIVANFAELCAAIRAFVISPRYDEALGTGNGVLVSFNHVFVNPTVAKGQCRVRFKIAGVEYDVWDDGEGHFVHDKIVYATSSIVYNDDVTIVFTAPPDNGYEIDLCYTNGATEGRDWLPLLSQKTRDDVNAEIWPTEDLTEIILRNSGISYKENIIVGIREWQYAAEQYWSLQFNVYHKYDAIYETAGTWLCNPDFTGFSAYDGAREYFSQLPHVPVKNDSMVYWIASNKRRIQAAVRVTSTIYLYFYLGGGRRISSPSRYALPNVGIGAVAGQNNYTSTNNKIFGNIFSITPYNAHLADASILRLPMYDHAGAIPIKKTSNSKVLPYPIYLFNGDPADKEALMELDGIFWTPDKDLTTEDTLDAGAYLIFQDAHRTTYTDYYAMRLE